MKNIFRIFRRDCRNIGKNVVALVVVMGLGILPSLYAWFNILSNWDPYGPSATSNIKVAVSYDDTGIDIAGVNINISANIVEALKTNDSIGWVFTDSSNDAIEGVRSGDYYAALIMPADFSKDMVSFMSDSMTHPEIIYYTNQKKNAIAPKITDKAKTSVKQQVNATFISTLTNSLVKSIGIVNAPGHTDTTEVSREDENISGNTLIDLIIAKLKVADVQINSFDTMLTALSNIVGTADSTAETAGAMNPNVSDHLTTQQTLLTDLQNTIGKSSLMDSDIFGVMSTDINTIQNYMNSISNIYDELCVSIDDYSKAVENIESTINDSLAIVHDLESQLQESIDNLINFKESGTYSLLQTAVSLDSEELSNFVSSPVAIDSVDLYPIENYGSAMSPFYSVLAIWVGALILVAIIHVKVKDFDEDTKINSVQTFFGRYMIFFLIGQAQALLICLGDLLYIKIQCNHPIKFWFACAFTSFVFTMITYSLTVAFENIGEAVAVVIMVIQVAGAGGTFPIQCLPAIYQAIYKYLPFTYAMDALRECVGGTYGGYYWKCILCLGIYVIISLLIGIVIAIPCKKLNTIINASKEKSGLMI
ncbi:MAG: YhgE/Pip domain-containing protein [Eubacteriales bacterium]|nr:YhgE/Pip domain-containing protein [Eubacteriales bacterium]